jgi:hypothetical protein
MVPPTSGGSSTEAQRVSIEIEDERQTYWQRKRASIRARLDYKDRRFTDKFASVI